MTRKFEKISFEQFAKDCESNHIYINEEQLKKLYDNIKLPERKTKYSAGYDFHTPFPFTIAGTYPLMIPTGIKCKMDEDEYLTINIRSSLGIKYNIQLANVVGIIDSDYYQNVSNDGHIMIGIIKLNNEYQTFQAGDAIAQGIFCKYYITDDDIANSEREGGIGSTNV